MASKLKIIHNLEPCYFHIRVAITNLSAENLKLLEEELKVWIHRDPMKSGPGAKKAYRIPGDMYSNRNYPEDVTQFDEYAKTCKMELDIFLDDGKGICKEIYRMLQKRISEGKDGYFEKFHHIICSQCCENALKCPNVQAVCGKE